MTEGGLPAWWYEVLKKDKKAAFWEKSLGASLGAPTAAEARRNEARAERRRQFAAAIAAHEAYTRLTQIRTAPRALSSVPPVVLTDRAKLRRRHERAAVKGIPLWRREARRRARAHAAVVAEHDADIADEAAQKERDRILAPLLKHEHDAVVDSLAATFEDFPHRVLAVGSTDGGSVVFIAVSEACVPLVEPALTPTGKLTTRRLKQRERNWLFAEAVASAAINAARYALTAAPGGHDATAVAFRSNGAGFEPIAWLSLLREDDGGWQAESLMEVAFVVKGGVMRPDPRTYRLLRVDFVPWPELGEAAAELKVGSGDESLTAGIRIRVPRPGTSEKTPRSSEGRGRKHAEARLRARADTRPARPPSTPEAVPVWRCPCCKYSASGKTLRRCPRCGEDL
jgi:hypothetical protein